jgi:hypothetical protein
MEQQVIILAASIATTLVGWLLLVYIWSVRKTVRKHVLRHDQVDWLAKR